jgi:hypothetical protein
MKMESRTILMKQKFPTLQVLAAAVVAYEHNHQRIERNALRGPDQTIVPNRQLMLDCLQGCAVPFVINDFHVKQAESIVQYLQQTGIMQTLINRNDRFLNQINQLLLESSLNSKDFGIIAWAPKLVSDYQKKDHVREVSAQFERRSRYIGKLGDKIQTDFTLIDSRYIQSMDCHAVYGHDGEGNLLFYWAKESKKIINSGRMQGRVKAHNQDTYRGNACVTTLNYVKII